MTRRGSKKPHWIQREASVLLLLGGALILALAILL
jgi:hypothetical protein